MSEQCIIITATNQHFTVLSAVVERVLQLFVEYPQHIDWGDNSVNIT